MEERQTGRKKKEWRKTIAFLLICLPQFHQICKWEEMESNNKNIGFDA